MIKPVNEFSTGSVSYGNYRAIEMKTQYEDDVAGELNNTSKVTDV